MKNKCKEIHKIDSIESKYRSDEKCENDVLSKHPYKPYNIVNAQKQ
jgi:hypothetical protein